jgi:hypothetical protein
MHLHVEPPVPPVTPDPGPDRRPPPVPPGPPFPTPPIEDPPVGPPDLPPQPPPPIVSERVGMSLAADATVVWTLRRAPPRKGFAMRLLDRKFKYVPSAKTDIAATWRRFGFRPTTDAERRARQIEWATGEQPGSPPDVIADVDLRKSRSRDRSALRLVAE